jgi:nitrite reductase/ring-hydroxylating ferredoxin subunit
MASDVKDSVGPDLTEGILSSSLAEGACLEGHVGEETVLLARRGDAVLAVSGKCTHYGAPLADVIMVGETVRCPWHHACFNLRIGRRSERLPMRRSTGGRWNTGVAGFSSPGKLTQRMSPLTTRRSPIHQAGSLSSEVELPGMQPRICCGGVASRTN